MGPSSPLRRTYVSDSLFMIKDSYFSLTKMRHRFHMHPSNEKFETLVIWGYFANAQVRK